MTDIVELKRMLVDRVQSVVEHLLPGGKREGAEWLAGSTAGESGRSLGVRLHGPKAGIWKDFADTTGEDGGDLIDLWVKSHHVDLTQALDEIRTWLGVTRPEFTRPARKQYIRPAKPRCVPPVAKVKDYLTEIRNLPLDVIALYKVAEDGENIIFPFLLPNGELALAKRRKAEDGAKPVPTAADCEPVLFGWQAMPDDARDVVITEGEIDAMSWRAYGWPALSVPFGGGGGDKQKWIESEFERMERFERIYLATDMDEQGDKAADEIANRLGRHRCLRVSMPHKDGNACLVEGVPREVMERCLAEAKHLDPEGLRRASEFADNVVALFYPAADTHVGYETPYEKLAHRLKFRPAEVTVWTGDSGAGKSQLLSDCSIDWVRQGSRICISSLEMKPAQTLKRMCKQVVGTDRPTEAAIRASLLWLDPGLLIYELTGKQKTDTLLDVFRYARAKYGCDQFVIDSLLRLGIAGDDYNGQEAVVYRIVDWAITHNVHVHLVAHARKGERDRGVPGTEDIKGASEIGANAFNIISVWRNRKLEEDIRAAETDDARRALRKKPGVIVNVAKQRNGDFEGKVGLWFDEKTYRYHGSDDGGSWKRSYLPSGIDLWNEQVA